VLAQRRQAFNKMRPILDFLSLRAHVEVLIIPDVPVSIVQTFLSELDPLAPRAARQPGRHGDSLRALQELVVEKFTKLKIPMLFVVVVGDKVELCVKTLK
jgi:hypothetical protein